MTCAGLDVSENHPSGNDLRQNDSGGPNHSIYLDNATKKTLTDPDSFKFISATLWTQDFPGYGAKAWICQAEYRSKNATGRYDQMTHTVVILDNITNHLSDDRSIDVRAFNCINQRAWDEDRGW